MMLVGMFVTFYFRVLTISSLYTMHIILCFIFMEKSFFFITLRTMCYTLNSHIHSVEIDKKIQFPKAKRRKK